SVGKSSSAASARMQANTNPGAKALERQAGRQEARLAASTLPAASLLTPSVVVEDRANATVLREQRVAAVAEQVQIEVLVRLPLAVALHLDGDRLRRLAGIERQRTGTGQVVPVRRRGGPVGGPIRHRHRLVVGGRQRDGEGEERRPARPALQLAHVADA